MTSEGNGTTVRQDVDDKHATSTTGAAAGGTNGTAPAAANGRRGPRFTEDQVLERIDAFRRRRPRLHEEVVTLAHGAGG